MKIALLTALAGLAIGTAALAQNDHQDHHPEESSAQQTMPMKKGVKPSETPGGGMMGGMGRGMMSDRCPMMGMMTNSESGETHAAGRVAFIKAELGITEAQQEAFDSYASALKKNLDGMHSMRAKMMSVMQSGTPLEKLSGHIDKMEGRLATLKQVKPALEKLYAVLSDAQKKKANKVLTGMGCMG